jgi:hypothetical protein
MKLRLISTAFCAALAALCSTAYAGPVIDETGPNLVTNGGFESTSAVAGSGWTATGFTAEGFDYFVDTSSADAHSGSHSFAGGGIGAPGYLSQTIATTAGQNYNIHIWLANLSGFADGTAISVLWGGTEVYSATDIAGFSYNEIVIDPLALSASTVLSIGLRDDSFFLNVDDIAVRAVSDASTPVPEPFTLSIFGVGIAGAVAMRRRKAKL